MPEKLKIYGVPPSNPCRIVFLACEALGLEYEVIPTNPRAGDCKTPEFLKLNPYHNVPVLRDGDLALNESRPIAMYLCNAYGRETKLYPADPKARAVIDHRLFFDGGTYYQALIGCAAPVIFGGQKEVASAAMDKMKEAVAWVRDMLKPTGYIAGTDHMTLADVVFLATTATLMETGLYPDLPAEIKDWFKRCSSRIPNYERANGEGAAMFGNFYKTALAKNKA